MDSIGLLKRIVSEPLANNVNLYYLLIIIFSLYCIIYCCICILIFSVQSLLNVIGIAVVTINNNNNSLFATVITNKI